MSFPRERVHIYLLNVYASFDTALAFCVQLGAQEKDMWWIQISLFSRWKFWILPKHTRNHLFTVY